MIQAADSDTAVLETVREAVGNAGAEQVFGAPIRGDGVTVIPVARVGGGGGGGRGTGMAKDGQQQSGIGGGLGVATKPLGVFVIKDGKVAWRPAVDVNKIILGGQLVAVTALLVLRAFIKSRCVAAERV
jgi:uncharacterized spore protein YtfJ